MIRIFIAEDDADDLEIFTEIITELHPDVEITHSIDGAEMLAKLQSNTPPFPDVIFLDLNMPRVNGHKCLEEIRKAAVFKDIPVVILSTSSHKDSIAESYRIGANRFISKPYNIHEFKRMLGLVINQIPQLAQCSFDTFYVNKV